ncbi:MAG: WGR domain-containing protein [Betaproteobacteria bacterium]|nr:WGR domain-containing protein [Betaproteobacteria bacterium]
MKRRFEYCDEKSNKFWEIEVIDKALTVTYGKIGTDGQSVTKKFKSADAALTEAEKQISEKTKKGYVEVISAPAGSKLRLTLETGAYFSNTSVYRKNKRSYFTVERRRTACSAIATEIRKPNSCTPVVISDVLFEGSSHKDAFFSPSLRVLTKKINAASIRRSRPTQTTSRLTAMNDSGPRARMLCRAALTFYLFHTTF